MFAILELLALGLLLPAETPGHHFAVAIGRAEGPDAESARRALMACMKKHPEAFHSPGRAETADDLRLAATSREPDGTLYLGRFCVDPFHKSYWVTHSYGEPGKGFHEVWHWYGRFERDAQGQWAAAPPGFQRAWGR